MKKINLLTLLFAISWACLAQNNASENVFEVNKIVNTKWNSSDGIPYKQVPGVNLGAMSFEILDNNRIAFLCNSTNEIIIVGAIDGKSLKRFPVTFAPRDFCYDKNKFYVLGEFKIDIYDESGKAIKSFNFDKKYVGVERITRYNNSTYLILPTGNSLLFEKNGQLPESIEYEGCITFSGNRISINSNNTNSFNVALYLASGKYESTYQTDKKVAGVFVVGATATRIILDLQSYLSENPIKVERKIVSIEINQSGIGKILSEIKIPDVYYVISNKDFSLSANGTLFNMITAPEGIFVYSLTESKSGNGYPKNLTDMSYHFNDHLIRTEE